VGGVGAVVAGGGLAFRCHRTKVVSLSE
jgi:hypothetical protein